MKPSCSASVTGAARGIGKSIAARLAADGLGISVADLPSSKDQVEAVVADLGGPEVALGLTVDVTDADSVEAAVADHVRHLGGLDVMEQGGTTPLDPPRPLARCGGKRGHRRNSAAGRDDG